MNYQDIVQMLAVSNPIINLAVALAVIAAVIGISTGSAVLSANERRRLLTLEEKRAKKIITPLEEKELSALKVNKWLHICCNYILLFSLFLFVIGLLFGV